MWTEHEMHMRKIMDKKYYNQKTRREETTLQVACLG
jgi:hypothetical protein